MFVARETMHCKPGKVREMVDKFRGLSGVLERLGFQPFRIYTDVSGEQFWTVVIESESESLDGFFQMEAKAMADAEAGRIMAGYHDLIERGRREIFRVES